MAQKNNMYFGLLEMKELLLFCGLFYCVQCKPDFTFMEWRIRGIWFGLNEFVFHFVFFVF